MATVTRVRAQSPTIRTIYFLLAGGWKLEYTAGQYITVFIPGSSTPQGKAYSLSSAPHEKWMSITVKNIGEFSGFLCALKTGDSFTISRAYGYFNPATTRPLVALAAGVGISPIASVLKDEFHKSAGREAYLFYSNKSHRDIPHRAELDNCGATIRHHITASKSVPSTMQKGRIALDECVQAAENAFYMVCGGVEFVRDMWRGLTERGVEPSNITTETFFES